MAQDDEIYFKVATDFGDLKPQFQDLSKYWDKHNQDIAKAEKAYRDYANTTDVAYKKVNQKIKDNIGQVAAEGKAVQQLETYFERLAKKNKEAFDSKDIKEFEAVLKKVSKDLGGNTNFDLNLEEFDELTKQLTQAKDDFDALNIIVDFFENKMTSAAGNSGKAIDTLEGKIERTKDAISGLENLIKDYDNQIDSIAPGKVQSGLIGERNKANKSLQIQNKLLEEYKTQSKSASQETLSLTTQLRRVKDEMIKLELEGKSNGERYDELREKAEKYNEVLQRTNRELRRTSSSTESLDKVIGATTALVGVFTVAEGASALLGEENEDLAKALIRVNGAVALLNGLQAIQAELAKKEALTTRAITYLRGQYTIATNASATATARLSAALKLTGVGLLIGGIAAAVYYWEDIAKAIGITTENAERLNEINLIVNDTYGEQIAQLSLLNDQVKKGGLSVQEQERAVKNFNETQGESLGTVKDYQELEKKLIDQGDEYVQYMYKKAKAEASYQIAVEKTKEALEKRNSSEETVDDYLTSFFTSGVNKFRSDKGNVTIEEAARRRNKKAADELDAEAQKAFADFEKFQSEADSAYIDLGITIDDTNKKIGDGSKKLSSLFEDLIKKQRDIKTSLIENDREREKQILQDELFDQKEARAKEIEALEVSQDRKLAIIKEFNKLYNEETGIAYEQLRKNLQVIDDKYNAELEKVKLTALQAIDEVFLSQEEQDRKAIKDRFDKIREEIFKQIDQTNDEVQKQELAALIFSVDSAEEKETDDFNLKTGIGRVEREKKAAESILRIYQANNRSIINDEKLKQLQLLKLEEEYLLRSLDTYRDSLKNYEDKSLYQELINTLATSTDPDQLKEVAQQLKDTFGEEIANEILETVGALKEVKVELKEFEKLSPFEKLVDDIEKWTESLMSFGMQLAEALKLEGKAADEFAKGIATAIGVTWDSLRTIFDAEIDQHKERLDTIQNTIDGVEDSLERERQLYEDGYANNYEARKQDLENLKEQKKKEEEELKKAQKRKAALAKAELLIDTVSQLGNLITASTNIFKWASKIPFIGIPLAIGLIGTMFGAFAVAKTKAFQAIGDGAKFRKGLQKGPVKLSGPTHEEEGFGVHNSKTGEKVAEVENNESLYVLNPQQQKAYDHLLQAMIADARGEKDIAVSMRNHYKLPQTGQTTLKVVERVNHVTIHSQKSKGEAAKESDSIIKEVTKIRERLDNEFEGYKKERDESVKTWETTEYFFVKTGNTTKKYKKK